MNLPVQIAIVLAAFLAVTGVAQLAGASNLGIAVSFGQIAAVVAVLALLLTR